jgi:hypothetical protein
VEGFWESGNEPSDSAGKFSNGCRTSGVTSRAQLLRVRDSVPKMMHYCFGMPFPRELYPNARLPAVSIRVSNPSTPGDKACI